MGDENPPDAHSVQKHIHYREIKTFLGEMFESTRH